MCIRDSTSPAPPRKWNLIPFSGGSSGYEEDEPGVYRTMSYHYRSLGYEEDPPQPPYYHSDSVEMNSDIISDIVNHYSSKAEEVLFATNVLQFLSKEALI